MSRGACRESNCAKRMSRIRLRTMAGRERRPEDLAYSAEVCKWFYERLGATTQREFADRIGAGESRVNLYLNGKRIPDGAYLLAMIREAGLLASASEPGAASGEATQEEADAAVLEAARVLEEAGRRILDLAADLRPSNGSSRRAG